MTDTKTLVHSADNFSIDVVYAVDKKFLPHLATSIASLVDTNREILGRIFIVGHIVDSVRFRIFQAWLKFRYGVRIDIRKPGKNVPDGLFTSRGITTAAYYRLLIGDIVPREVNRILYLDADTIVLGSLRDLGRLYDNYNASSSVALWASASEQPMPHLREQLGEGSSTFNSGVLLIDLNEWRNAVSTGDLLGFARDKGEELLFHDQDVLNLVFANHWGRLPSRFNRMRSVEVLEEDAVVHFVGSEKPWRAAGRKHPYARRYSYFRRKTTFFPYLFEGIARHVVRTHILYPLKTRVDPHYASIRRRFPRLNFFDSRTSAMRWRKSVVGWKNRL